MRDKDTPSVSPEVSIMDSVARAELTEIAVDFAELTIDALLDNELLQAIPIVGTVARLYRSSVSIRDGLFLRKVLLFLKEFDDIPKEDRERFVEELDASEGTRAKAGAALMLLLDRLDDVDKPQLIGRLFVPGWNSASLSKSYDDSHDRRTIPPSRYCQALATASRRAGRTAGGAISPRPWSS